jgi:tubulin monoglycylase TTLL15
MSDKSTRHFFELVRFDFIIDSDFKVYLMEINMSPNITPESEKFEKNAIIREKMVNDVLQLIGAGSYFDIMTR